MKDDPYTIIVALDSKKSALGQIYLDDGNSFDFASRGAFRLRQLTYSADSAILHTLKSTLLSGSKSFAIDNEIERIVIAGIGAEPKKVVGSDGSVVTFSYSKEKDVLTLRKPSVKVCYDFNLKIEF
jgi:alpha 1,3-glucosidase